MLKETCELTQNVSFHGVFDFGKDAFAALEIELECARQENIEIVLGEICRDNQVIHTPGFRTFIQHFVTTQAGHQVIKVPIRRYAPAFSGFPYCNAPDGCDGEIAPFRYVEINRHSGKVTVRRTAYYCDWADEASGFVSSDAVLNEIWEFCKYSIKAASVFDKYVDGERERLPYEGDAYINQLGHFSCSAPDFTKARATIDHFFEYDRHTWPVEWYLLTPMLIADYLLYSGDRATVDRWLNEVLDKKLLLDALDENGLLNRQNYAAVKHGPRLDDLVDWPPSERDNYDFKQVNFVPNAYLYRALLTMHGLTGRSGYLTQAETLKQNIRRTFLKNGIFVDSAESSHTSLHTALFALAFDLAQDQEIDLCKKIIRQKDMACSVYCAQFLLEVCFRYGMADHALKLLTSDSDRSWCNMLREGATISMESWGDKWKPNQDWNHAWGAAPANIIPRYLAGIRPAAAGFRKFTVDPQFGSLQRVSFFQTTVAGVISLDHADGKTTLTVPPGTQALYQGNILEAGTHIL